MSNIISSDTIVSGIVCTRCNHELPPMTAQEHLDGKFNKECPHTKEGLIMQEWVMNDMYEGLLKMPLWVLSAFGSLMDGDKLSTGDVRVELIIWLVVQSMNKCPPQFYDNDYRHEWKTAPYIPLVKQAVKSARESLKHDTKTPP